MRRQFHLVLVFLAVLLLFGGASCYEDLAIKEPCSFDEVDIQIIPEAICVPDCMKTFNLSNITSLPGNTEFLWTLRRETEVLPLPDPTVADFEFEFVQGGMYSLSVAVSFPDFSGCNFVLDTSFSIGVPQVVAVIEVDRQQCIVGECDLTFSFPNEGDIADTWTWEFSDGDPGDYQNQSTVEKSFDICPDTIRVILTAQNQGSTDRDTMLIYVDPVTFDVAHKIANGAAEKVLCIRETGNGDFQIIGNSQEQSYVAEISRDGELLSSMLLEEKLPPEYTLRFVNDCHVLNDNIALLGSVLVEPEGQTAHLDSYLLLVDNQFSGSAEHALRPQVNGDEEINDIVPSPGGGYLVCGARSSPTRGMLFFRLDASFSRDDDFTLFEGTRPHVAWDISPVNDGYIVVGELTNPASNAVEGCSFRMDQNFQVVASSLRFYGFVKPIELIPVGEEAFVFIGQKGNSSQLTGFGSINWSIDFGNTTLTKGIKTSDQKLVVTGSTKIDGKDAAVLIKIDPDNGTIIFNQAFPLPSTDRKALAIAPTKENGFVIGGLQMAADSMFLVRSNKSGDLN